MLRQLALRGRQLCFGASPVQGLIHPPATRLWRTIQAMAGESDTKTARQAPSRRRRSASAAEKKNADGVQQSDRAAASSPKPPAKRSRTKKATPSAAAAPPAAAESQEIPPAVADGIVHDSIAAANGDAPANGESAAAVAAAEKPKPKRKPKPPPGPLYDVSMRAPKYEGPAHRFLSWNVAGFRALLKKDAEALKKLVADEQLDAVCLQETKLQAGDVEKVVEAAGLTDWHVTFNCSTAKKGYSGTATLCKDKPLSTKVGIGIAEHDDEGRVVAVELADLWLVNVYVPNSGEGLKRLEYRTEQWDKAFAQFIKDLQSGPNGKPVVVTGDLNCAHQEIDIHEPKRNLRSAGFTQEERDSFGEQILGHAGLVDTFRAQHPGVVGYTYYSYRFNARATNKGWRLDYFLVSSDIADSVHDSYILKEVTGSDHCPLGIVIKKNTH